MLPRIGCADWSALGVAPSQLPAPAAVGATGRAHSEPEFAATLAKRLASRALGLDVMHGVRNDVVIQWAISETMIAEYYTLRAGIASRISAQYDDKLVYGRNGGDRGSNSSGPGEVASASSTK